MAAVFVVSSIVASAARAAAPATLDPAPLSAAVVQGTVEALADTVDKTYFDPLVAGRVAVSLRQSLAAGVYAEATTPPELARLLTRSMFAVTSDKRRRACA